MKSISRLLAIGLVLTTIAIFYGVLDARRTDAHDSPHGVSDDDFESKFDREIRNNGARMIRDGREIFRYDTFGDEEFWGDELRLHERSPARTTGESAPV